MIKGAWEVRRRENFPQVPALDLYSGAARPGLPVPRFHHDIEVRSLDMAGAVGDSFGVACRLDRLLLLLDTGSSTSVRTTAAKQLAQLAVKSVISDVTIVEDDIKSTRQHASAASDSATWSELMSVVARVRNLTSDYPLLSNKDN